MSHWERVRDVGGLCLSRRFLERGLNQDGTGTPAKNGRSVAESMTYLIELCVCQFLCRVPYGICMLPYVLHHTPPVSLSLLSLWPKTFPFCPYLSPRKQIRICNIPSNAVVCRLCLVFAEIREARNEWEGWGIACVCGTRGREWCSPMCVCVYSNERNEVVSLGLSKGKEDG